MDQDFLARQRTFIHDIATPVSVAQGMLNIVLSRLKSQPESPIDMDKLEKAVKALEKLEGLIEDNRKFLIAAASEEK
jgi:signal transduction histidine kinase